MEGSFLASSFHPPDVAAADAAAATTTTTTTTTPLRYPSWVLLDRTAYFADRENATTAEAKSSIGRIVKVTFCLADPPAVSHFCVHGPEFNREDFAAEPKVLFSEKDLVLLAFVFAVGSGSTARDSIQTDYFIYKASYGNPSLTPIPATPPGNSNTLYVGIVLCEDGNEGEFFLADLALTTTLGHYDLSIFSSKTATWTTRTLQIQASMQASVDGIRAVDMFVVSHKVITLGEGVVGWVDLWRGIIACNILEKDPFIYFIPLPKPEFNLARKGDPKPVRDVTCYNEVINFVKMDHIFIREVVTINNNNKRFKVTADLDSTDIIYDKKLLLLPHEDFLGLTREQITYVSNGWKIRTCYRHASSDNWRKGYSIHVDDFLPYDPTNPMLLPQLLDGSASKSLRDMTTVYPTLSINGDDVVYLVSKVDYHDKNAWIVGVDLRKKTVEIVKPYFAERASYFKPDLLTCGFSKYLNKFQRACIEHCASSSQNDVNHGHLSSNYGYQNGITDVYGNKQYPSTLFPNLSQPLHPNLTTSASGHVYPLNFQSVCPVLNTDAHGQLWLSMPLGGPFLSQLLELARPPFTPLMSPLLVPDAELDRRPANVVLPPPGKRGPPAVQHDSGPPNENSMLLGTSRDAVDPSPPAQR